MTKLNEIISSLKETNIDQAEIMEEKIDIIIHKLKFLKDDSLPLVAIYSCKNNFELRYNSLLAEKVKIAGGHLSKHSEEDPQIIILDQDTSELYQTLPSYIEKLKTKKVRALLENKIFITKNYVFQDNDSTYIQDVELLAEIIHPKYFVFGREGQDWTQFDIR